MTAVPEDVVIDAPEPPEEKRPRWRRVVAILGVLLIVAGLGVLGWVGWQYYGTNIIAKRQQAEMRADLQQRWDRGEDPFADGEAFALLRVPRFGDDYQMPIIKGVDDDALSSGVGWFTDTQRPGRPGNFALAGHRVTHGEPFRDFPDLREGDEVYVETRTRIYTYVLEDDGTDHQVPFSETWILDPVPGRADAQPTEALITLMTCSELFNTVDRSYVFGHLTATQAKGGRDRHLNDQESPGR
jgi:sortase A